MPLLARGIAWFLLYVLLVIAPAVVAIAVDPFAEPRAAPVEISAGLGFFAFPLILVQFALVSHLRTSSRPFGTDALVQFHRYMGFAALAVVLATSTLSVDDSSSASPRTRGGNSGTS